jgi:hypothetical protein
MILRSCNSNFTSAHDSTFRWPSEIGAIVEPVSWNPEPICGYGLHGFQYGEGDSSLADMSDSAQWIVFSGDEIVSVDNSKVKTNRATILHIGQGLTGRDRMLDCHAFMRRHRMLGSKSFYSTNSGGYSSTNSGGNYSTNSGGDSSTNSGGDSSTNTGGDSSTNSGGDSSTNSGGYSSTNSGGNYSTNSGGDYSTNTGGNSSTNSGGYSSTNSGGDYSTNSGGDYSYFTTGDNSSYTGSWYDDSRIRRKSFYSGEDYESGVKYYFENGVIRKV